MVFKINLVAARWIRSNLEIFLDVCQLVCVDHTTLQYSSCDVTRPRYRVLKVESSWNPLQVLGPRILSVFFDILSIRVLQDRLHLVTKPRSRNSDVSSRISLFKCTSEWIGVLLLVICFSLPFFTLNSTSLGGDYQGGKCCWPSESLRPRNKRQVEEPPLNSQKRI